MTNKKLKISMGSEFSFGIKKMFNYNLGNKNHFFNKKLTLSKSLGYFAEKMTAIGKQLKINIFDSPNLISKPFNIFDKKEIY